MIIGVPDSKLKKWMEDKEYIKATDEGEAVCIGVGHYLATGKPATVFMGGNGLFNALDAITSLVIPYDIPIKLIIGLRTDVFQHKIAGNTVKKIIDIIYAKGTRDIKFIK